MEKLTRHSIQWFYNLLAKGVATFSNKNTPITKVLKNSSLQSSLQTQALLQTLYKENNPDCLPFIKTPFAHPFAETTNLSKA
ncbi:MAG: hypothetical protein KKF98_07035 [Bacteroidetes bacterium]|nr:hypothetical protein [Bacteroidota bacterium]